MSVFMNMVKALLLLEPDAELLKEVKDSKRRAHLIKINTDVEYQDFLSFSFFVFYLNRT